MKQGKRNIASSEIRNKFATNLEPIFRLATTCAGVQEFRLRLTEELQQAGSTASNPGKENIKRLVEFDGQTITEASTGREITLRTITLLWHFLNDHSEAAGLSTNFLIDVYKQFERLYVPTMPKPDKQQVTKWMRRWPVGTDERIMEARKRNRQRIIERLIRRVELRHSEKNRYVFPPGLSAEAKQHMVEEWWNDFRFHLSLAARSVRELNYMLGGNMLDELLAVYHEAQRKGIPVFVTPYYLSLIDTTGSEYDDASLRSYVFYSRNLVDAFGHIRAWEKEDAVVPGQPNAAGWLLPDGHNIHRRYPDVAILIPDTIGRACGGLCASCQRMYDFQSGRFNFDMESLKPKEGWDSKLRRLMRYFEEDTQLRDILITGGDALMSRNGSLRNILDAVYTMAKRKREQNKHRAEGEKFAELQRVRLGTRLPVYLPMRIDDELIGILHDFKQRAVTIGITQFFIQTHFQTPLEVTPEACLAVSKLQSAGWTVTNQLVFNVAVSRRGHTARLRQVLNKLGVLCYYTFTVKGFEENHAVFAPNSRTIQEQQEEKILGQLDAETSLQMARLLEDSTVPMSRTIRRIMADCQIPFLASDRNVLNLPGIGKSMTFGLVGIMPDGCRVLAFDHDHTRKHSPLVEQMPVIYIKENKSVEEYLCQLSEMGEQRTDYESIWQYTDGRTEERFPFYEYPSPLNGITERYTHLASFVS